MQATRSPGHMKESIRSAEASPRSRPPSGVRVVFVLCALCNWWLNMMRASLFVCWLVTLPWALASEDVPAVFKPLRCAHTSNSISLPCLYILLVSLSFVALVGMHLAALHLKNALANRQHLPHLQTQASSASSSLRLPPSCWPHRSPSSSCRPSWACSALPQTKAPALPTHSPPPPPPCSPSSCQQRSACW
jgi:hypothetical protein